MGVSTDLFSGTVSGMVASLVGQPLDRVRVLLQSRGQLYRGSWDVVVKTCSSDGLRGFFRGALPPVLGMGPKNAVGFVAQAWALRWFEGAPGDTPTNVLKRGAGLLNIAAAGCVAGLVQSIAVVPTDRLKCQLQIHPGPHTPGYQAGTLRQVATTLIREEGLCSGLFRGLWPTVWRQVLSAPVYFGSYEALKRGSIFAGADPGSFLVTLISGGLAGVGAYASTYPFDILKTYAQAAPPGTPCAEVRMVYVAALMQKRYGPHWWLRALAPTLGRAFVINAVNFALFESAVAHSEGFFGYCK